MIYNLLLNSPSENFRTVRLYDTSMLGIAIFLGLCFITAIVIIIIKSGKD